ncbi:4-alpha-glucanotransferase [Galenea microaerophila]
MKRTRQAGVLMHITSLPNNSGLGKLDEAAWRFLDWMVASGLSVWQMLPLTQPAQGLSPYQSLSAFAMNPALLPDNWQQQLDKAAYEQFLNHPPHWLHDYALFIALRETFQCQPWSDWPEAYKKRDPQALAEFAQQHQSRITLLKQQQFMLDQLWQQLKADAHAKGIQLFGDMPMFVAYDSADVWVNPDQFKLDDALKPSVVAGVPPDYFSKTGQYWGNPLYHWEVMAETGFDWWIKRFAQMMAQFDYIRFDHFRGLVACWEIDAQEKTAEHGHWQPVPGKELLSVLHQRFPEMKLVAEDLGEITPEVKALKEAFHLPGMSVLQFGFEGDPQQNPNSLQSQVENSVVYTGTHDNDTTLGWWNQLEEQARQKVTAALADYQFAGEMPWPMIAAAMASPAFMMIAPMQDYLGLGTEARMNVPGTCEGNWAWQLDWQDLPEHLSNRIKHLTEIYHREGPMAPKISALSGT